MIIRRATIEDLDDIWQLANESFAPSPWPKEVFEHELRSPRSIYFVTTGGFLGATQILDEVEVGSLGVSPKFQHQGIGQALLMAVFALPNTKRVLLEVANTNTAAQALYRKVGFQPYYRREKYYKNGDDAIMMERKID